MKSLIRPQGVPYVRARVKTMPVMKKEIELEDGTKISARPSGTEPKIKFYFSVHEKLNNAAAFDEVTTSLNRKIELIIANMNLK